MSFTAVDPGAERPHAREIAQRALLARAAHVLDLDVDAVTIVRQCALCGGRGHGAPRVHGPAGLLGHASLSYAPGLVAAAFRPGTGAGSGPGLGVDIVALDPAALAGVERTAMAGAELEYWRSLPEADRPAALASAWAAKEAILKARGTGLADDPREVRVLGVPAQTSDALWRPLDVPSGYAGAIAGS